MTRPSLRIAVSNLQSGIGTTRGWWHYLATGWKYRLPHDSSAQIEDAARFLTDEAVDVAMLCEVDASCRRSRWRDQLDDLCDASPLKERAFFPTRVVGRRVNQGNAICARLPLRYVKNHALPGHGEPRFVSEAELELVGLKVRLLMTHLSLERRLRSPQIHHIAELVAKRRGPTILAGDFNIAKQAELDLLHESELLERAVTGATFPAWRPRHSLDHLFVSSHFDVVQAKVFDDLLFADHLPLVVDVHLREPSSARSLFQ